MDLPLSPPPEGVDRLRKEIGFLEKGAPHLPVAVPRYEIFQLEKPLPFGGYRKLTGTPLSAATTLLSPAILQELG